MSELIEKLNKEINEYLESGSREDKACAEGLRMARTYIQQEALKRKILTRNQQIVLEWLKGNLVLGYGASLIRTIYLLQRENTIEIPENRYIREAYRSLSTSEEATVVQLFIDWALEQEEE